MEVEQTLPGAGEDEYEVKLESEYQELHIDILAQPCGEGKTEWCFRNCDQQPVHNKDLLLEVGEAIEKYQAQIS